MLYHFRENYKISVNFIVNSVDYDQMGRITGCPWSALAAWVTVTTKKKKEFAKIKLTAHFHSKISLR
jgi:hypothetical protein